VSAPLPKELSALLDAIAPVKRKAVHSNRKAPKSAPRR
jgi:hypothetical protein